MKRILFAALLGVLVLPGICWPSSAEAKTTYYKCEYGVFKFEEPWMGKDKLFLMYVGKLDELPLAEVTPEFIRFWWVESDQRKKPKRTEYINRITGETSNSGFCKKIDELE